MFGHLIRTLPAGRMRLGIIWLLITLAGADLVFCQNWAHWRGPHACGACPESRPPLEWNEQKNIKWKIQIPGKGYSTPVIWGDQIFFTATAETDRIETSFFSWFKYFLDWQSGEETIQTEKIHAFLVLSVNRKDGSIVWQRKVQEKVPLVRTHLWGSWASHSMTTDGVCIYAYFGSHGLYCLDLQGNIIWQRDLGKMNKDEGFGEGSTPVLYEDMLIIQRDHEGISKLIAFHKKTGETCWETTRQTNTSWSSPLVVDVGGKPQIITTATDRVQGYDLYTGEQIWECRGLSPYPIPTPIASDDLVYVMNGYEGFLVMAIDPLTAAGDITGSKSVVWHYTKSAPYTPSPLLLDSRLYFLHNEEGRLTCLEAKTGRENYSLERLRGSGYVLASPVGTRQAIYVVALKGKTFVIKPGPVFEVLSVNKLEDHFAASPLIIGDCLYLRGTRYLYCISEY